MNLDNQSLTAAAKGFKLALAGENLPCGACRSMKKGFLRGQARLKNQAKQWPCLDEISEWPEKNFEIINDWKISK